LSLRATFLLLLLANLAFLGWASLIDVRPEPAQSESIGNLPQLKLLSEVRSKPASSGLAAARSSASPSGTSAEAASNASATSPSAASGSATQGSGGAAASAGPTSSGSASSGSASSGSASSGAAANDAAANRAARTGDVSTAAALTGTALGGTALGGAALDGPASAGDPSRRCITIGPFADPERAREAADVLRERGFTPRARTAASGPPQGYWVFIAGLKSPAEETRVLNRLERNGISDAKAMPSSDAGRRISVGLFNAFDGAERRARAVRHLGLDAQVEPRAAGEAHWVDVDLNSSAQSLPAEGLLGLEEPGSRLEIKECPAAKQPRSTPDFAPVVPKPLTTAGRPRPG
jgi:hypothetical protein